ncbi:LytR C-terminal domain-containing protein [Pseudarthrobacter sp. J64]|uniref:LytR C-terminal domain-containing protein n=1 Tax=Pseudarthrobacter sp. J64 TaxID=3116485 RepID=UPI002E809D4A|nr:LytR C-terminal domain-containing protein [Pseudarthrobacter sp. J64]MEE2569859.1 LytR C-terminal domain-containing protein [Pseudarthrobacter sp. J64]
MTKYARDEFDQVPETSARQGVHRTVAAPARKRLWPIMAVGIAALLVGVGAFFILPTLGFGPGGTPAAVSDSPSESSAPTDAPTSEAPAEPTATAPAEEPSAEPEPEPTPSETAAGLDKTQAVAVYNGAGVAGLAGQVGGVVQTDGWAVAEVANWGGSAQQASVIFYAPGQQANAEALGELLRITTQVESAEFQVPLVVVLGPGYQ